MKKEWFYAQPYGTRWEMRGWVFGVIFTFVALVVAAAAIAVMNHIEAVSCERRADRLDIPFDYSIWTNCLVQVHGKWVPLDNYRGTDEL